MDYVNRVLEADIRTSLKRNPSTAILGPRQCGESTLARKILDEIKPSVYLGLERPSEMHKSPVLSDGNYAALKDIEPDVLYIVCPLEEGYPLKPGIKVVSLQELIEKIK
jgi:predicted AAA+ superfamily ATPase